MNDLFMGAICGETKLGGSTVRTSVLGDRRRRWDATGRGRLWLPSIKNCGGWLAGGGERGRWRLIARFSPFLFNWLMHIIVKWLGTSLHKPLN